MLNFTNITLSFSNDLNVSALSYASNVGVGFTFNPTLSVSLSNSDLVINNLSPNTGSDSNIITVNVSTNAAYGYDLFSTVGNTTNATTELKNGNNSFTSLSSNVATPASFGDNKWGYSYSTDSGTNWVSGDQGSTNTGYAGLPLYTGTGVKLASANSNTGSSVQFKIAAKAGATQASGEYTNIINFTAVAKHIPITLAEAYASEGKTMINGFYTMQDMTSTICSKVEAIGTQLQVLDKRDGKLYWVAKLADNHCWMTQNLDFFIDSSVTLDSLTTNLDAIYDPTTGQYAEYDNGYTTNNGVIYWTPATTASTTNFEGSTIPTWQDSNTEPYSANKIDDNNTGHESLGNYYNWTASIASNDSTSVSRNTVNSISQNPKNSICPKSWRLPTISDQLESDIDSTNEFARLNYLYNNNSSDSIAGLVSSPLYFNLSGIIGGSFMYLNEYGSYWSSTTYYTSRKYHAMELFLGNINGQYYSYPNDYYLRYHGLSIRCIAK